MFPTAFQYHRPTSIQEAITLMSTYGDEAKLLAGGHSLLPVMKLRFAAPAHLIDIGRIPSLSGIADSGGTLTIGATTKHADVAASSLVKAKASLLSETTAQIGDPLIRNRGTIGGSCAHADPGADLPAAMLALGATFTVVGPTGERTIGADAFFVDMFQTALGSGEMLTRIDVPTAGRAAAYEKCPDHASGYALVGVAAQLVTSGGTISSARVALTGLTSKAIRLAGVEAALSGQPATAATVAAAAARASDGLSVSADARGSIAYKLNLARVYCARALQKALSRA